MKEQEKGERKRWTKMKKKEEAGGTGERSRRRGREVGGGEEGAGKGRSKKEDVVRGSH